MLSVRPVSLFAVILAVFGCAGPPDPISGVYTWGAEVNTFRPCGGDKTFWVVAPDSVLHTLRSAHDSLASEPAQGILVEVMTMHSGRKPEGFAKRYDGVLGIVEVLSVQDSVPARCLETSWALPGRRPSYFP